MIRVTGGTFRGRTLKTPPREITRPALSSVRLAVFNIFAPAVPGCRFLDMFGGSGAYAIEAISRGASVADVIEINKRAAAVIRQNIESLGLGQQINLITGDALKVVPELARDGCVYDIIAVAPPHFEGLVDKAMLRLDQYTSILSADGAVFVQHHRDEPVCAPLVSLSFARTYVYGTTCVSVWRLV